MTRKELREFLDEKATYYEHTSYIDSDPILIPHRFSKKEDIEIAGFLTATIAWGNRKSIIRSATKLLNLMDDSPYDFVMNYQSDLDSRFDGFVHRTFNATDAAYFMRSLQNIYLNHDGLEAVIERYAETDSLQNSIHYFKKTFFELPHETRAEKHLGDPLKNSAAKRINMFLRWMVRSSKSGVDFGIWKNLKKSRAEEKSLSSQR